MPYKNLLLAALLLLPSCTRDKYLHVGAGVGIAGVSYAAGATWKQACGLSVAGGLAKEVYDSTGRGTPEVMDLVATGASGCLSAYIMDKLKR